MSSYRNYIFELLKKKGHRVATDPAGAIREFIEEKKFEQNLKLLDQQDFTQNDLQKNNAVMNGFRTLTNFEPKTINWFLPTFEHAYGGIYTILRFAEHFHNEKGIENNFIICGAEENALANAKDAITKVFPSLANQKTLHLSDSYLGNVPDSDISVATYWTTAYHLLKFNRTKGKFYFIQDYEPLFFLASFTYGLAEATYRFGFHEIINTVGVCNEVTRGNGGIAEYFTPCVDSKVFYPPQQSEAETDKPFTIFFYGRPNPRNGFELGIQSLKQLKEKYGNRVKIFSAGSKWNQEIYDSEGEIENLGVLPYEKTGGLYRSCDLGVVFMFTKHPSYLPFELMACGCPVLTNRNAATTWLLKDNINCALAEPTVSAVCERIESVMARSRTTPNTLG